jgi:hypothetical protein
MKNNRLVSRVPLCEQLPLGEGDQEACQAHEYEWPDRDN